MPGVDMDEDRDIELSIILPCRDEEKGLAFCLSEIADVIGRNNIDAEVVVSDSSSDRSPDVARRFGAVLHKHDKPGYGTACMEGFKAAKGRYIIMADPDGTYDFNQIPRFLDCLREGYDFVIGNRFMGNMMKNAMPPHHRYLGNPALSLILKVFFGSSLGDVQCGMRAFSKDAVERLKLKTPGMEFASEMVIKMTRLGFRMKEIPVDYRQRFGRSKLRSFTDGWRHLRLMLNVLFFEDWARRSS